VNFKRGSLFLIAAWVVVLLAGYFYNIWLARYFQQEDFGIYLLVMSVLVWIEIIVINGLPYAVQKFVSSYVSKAYGILRTAAAVQTIAAVVLFLVSVASAEVIAGFFKDTRLAPYFRIAFIDILFYGFFHLMIAFHNGLRHFKKQAMLLVFYSILKVGSGILLVIVTASLSGAFLANIVASIIGLLIGFFMLRDKKKQTPFDAKVLIRFAVPSLSYFLMLNLYYSAVLWIVKYFLGLNISAYYGASSLIARIPFFLFNGVSATVLPTIAADLAKGDLTKIKNTIQQATQFLLILGIPTGILITRYSPQIMDLLFPANYAPGAPILAILIWGMTLLAFLSLFTIILNADHRPKLSFIITGIAVILSVVFNVFLVIRVGVLGPAIGTTLAIGIGCFISIVAVYRRFHVIVSLKSILRIGIAASLVWFTSRFIPVDDMSFLFVFFIELVFFIILLVLFRELRIGDIMSLLQNSDDAETSSLPGSDLLSQ